MTEETLRRLEQAVPQLKAVREEREILWRNPLLAPAAQAREKAPLSM